MNSLEKSILATLVYYDVLDRPLTGWEIFKYLIKINKDKETDSSPAVLRGQNDRLNIILQTLENSPELKNFISQQNGFYFLKNREGLVQKRISQQIIADQKWKKARRIIKWLQLVPYLRLVMVSGSLAINNVKSDSDIDLLIVVKGGRIWTCRALTTLFVHLIGRRRHGSLTKDRLCLNHYLTDQSLKIPAQSLYNSQTYAHLTPLLEIEPGLYQKFQQANQWLNDYLFFYPLSQKGYLRKIKISRFFAFCRQCREFILDTELGNRLELWLKKIQSRRISQDPLTCQAGGRIIFNDQQLEFHPNSPEKKILEKYNKKLKELSFEEDWLAKDSGLTR